MFAIIGAEKPITNSAMTMASPNMPSFWRRYRRQAVRQKPCDSTGFIALLVILHSRIDDAVGEIGKQRQYQDQHRGDYAEPHDGRIVAAQYRVEK